MSNNLYWPIFQNLEREVIILSDQIHFDDNQLEVYSIKISELLIRTVVEVESISKELYLLNGGTKPNDNNLFFDSDCLDFLESKWILSKKKVLISASNFYFEGEENQILSPLHKAFKRGSSSADWLKAYQAIKHNRAQNLKKGNIKHLIKALAGLYILNLYYKDILYNLGKDNSGTNFNTSIGSNIFSVKIHSNLDLSTETGISKKPDFEECIYIIKPTDQTQKLSLNIMKVFNEKLQKRHQEHSATGLIPELVKEVSRENGDLVQKSFDVLRYEATLNKQQY